MKKIMLSIFLLIASFAVFAQMDVAKARVVVDVKNQTDQQAAAILQNYVKQISGNRIEIVSASQKIKKGDVLIGAVAGKPSDKLTLDGYSIAVKDGVLRINALPEGKGTIYGVCELLERFFGVRYWSPNAQKVSEFETMMIADGVSILENPAFEYRQTNGQGDRDEMYRAFRRLQQPKEVFASNLWVHTFNALLPASVYGDSHPEYYAFINGERRPGAQSQWCLSNDEVFEIVSHKVDSIFKSDPSRTIISISQNDGNATNCTCEKCKAIDDYQESLSGSIITFLNRLAARFPDKEFSTLAYTYSVKPPKHIKPLPNVNIMLCDIDCMRHLPLTETESGKEFVGHLEGWSRISDNLFVWDYGINFDNTVSPFPNFHILKSNIELFKKNNVTKIFEQVNSAVGVDFAELRSYMLTKLMWNPQCNSDELMRDFLWGYYGMAAQPLYDYLKLQQGGLVSSGKNLWIYDSPVTHKMGFLNLPMLKEYNRLFDQAEEAVKESAVLLNRVRLSRLPLQYAELEIARTLPGQNNEQLREKVLLFKQRTKEFGVISLNERANDPQLYCDLYLKRYLPSGEKNLAKGAAVEWIAAPSGRYGEGAEVALTDGLYGGTSFVESWVGWEGKDAEFVIDLGSQQEFTTVESDYLHQLGQWVFLPKEVRCSVSDDGINFVPMGVCNKEENRENSVLFDQFVVKSDKPVRARFVKVYIESIKKCPSWHYGIGHNAWLFVDEIIVK